jgi:hypothetical protein
MAADLIFNPELRLIDGSVIRDRRDAVAFARKHEWRAEGADVLRFLERAVKPEEVEAAGQRFRSWITVQKLLKQGR